MLRNMKEYGISTSYRTVPSPIWQIFFEFLMFCNLYHKPIGEWNKGKTWETSKAFVNIARKLTCDNYSIISSHSLLNPPEKKAMHKKIVIFQSIMDFKISNHTMCWQ